MPDYIGMRNRLSHDYALYPFQQFPNEHALIVMEERGRVRRGTKIEFFHRGLEAQEMDFTLGELRKRQDEKTLCPEDKSVLLGGLLFCCDSRANDLIAFRRHFPGTPCLEVNTDCQIGPRPLVLDNLNRDPDQFGDSVMQTDTAVMVLFFSPYIDPVPYNVTDDSVTNVNRFLRVHQGFCVWSQWEQQFGWGTAMGGGDCQYATQWCKRIAIATGFIPMDNARRVVGFRLIRTVPSMRTV